MRSISRIGTDDAAMVSTPVVNYGAAIAAVAASLTLRWLFNPWVGDYLPLSTLYGAVAFSVWFGGYRPALLAVVLGYLAADWLFIPPRYAIGQFDAQNSIGLLLFLLSCAIIIAFGEAMRVARHRADVRQEALRVTFKSIGDAVITTDLAGRVMFLNGVAESLTAWTHQDAVGRPLDEVFRIVNEGTREGVENPATKAIRDGVVVGLANHTVLIAKDGTERPIDDSAAPIRNDDGELIGCVLIFRDISARRAVERHIARLDRELQSRVNDLQAVLDVVPMGVAIANDPECSRIITNPFLSDLLGVPVGANASLTAPSDERPRSYASFRDGVEVPPEQLPMQVACTGVEVRDFEVDLVREGRDSRRLLCSARPLFDEEDRIRGSVGAFADITDRRHVEQRLQKKNERLRLLSEAASHLLSADEPDVMLHRLFDTISPHFGLDAYFNYMVDGTGTALRRQSSAGISSDAALSINRLEFGQAICGTVALQQQPVVATFIQQSDDPKVQLVKSFGIRAYACNPLMVDDKLIGTLSFASRSRDQFDTDELEFLKTICHYVTIAYERVRLIEKLREADRRKDEFLATLAHELRNPLAPVRNAVQILQLKGSPIPELQWARDVVERQIQQMTRLIDDLMDVSRIALGRITLKKERSVLAEIVRGAVETSRSMIEQAGHELTVNLPEQPIFLDADLTRLAQVFSNLLNNAAKYTERGGRIHLTAEREGSDVVVSVKDTGIGIPKEKLESIFEMFSQVQPLLERSQGGLGIGLSLVKRLVEMHGGRIEARSEGVGHGSEFVVRLPVLIEHAAAKSNVAGIEAVASMPSHFRIVVVDDNKDAADTLAMMLRIAGNEIKTAYDGEGVVDLARDFRPHVIVLDIGLPKVNGYEVCRRIREQEWGKGLVLIAVTGWGQDEDKAKAKDAGFDRHMVKPVDPQSLMKTLSDLQFVTGE